MHYKNRSKVIYNTGYDIKHETMIDGSLLTMTLSRLHLHLIIILNHSWPSSTDRTYVSLIRLAKEDYALSKSTCSHGNQNAIHSTLQGHERGCEFMNNKLIFIIKDLVTFRFPSFELFTDCGFVYLC